ncbi:MAG: AraC family transcriptional regulator [Gammaproteobacteria bacterium]
MPGVNQPIHVTPGAAAPRTPQAVTPMAFVQAMCLALERQGLAPEPLLRQAQIAPPELDRPDARINALQMEVFSGLAMRALDDEALGWFERPLPWGSYGMLARASLSAPTLGVALRRWCRHHGLLTRDITLGVDTAEGTCRIVLTEHRPPGGDGRLREFCCVSVLRNFHGLACWLVDSRIPLLGAAFAFAAPPHADVYPLLFDGPATFDAAETALRFDARYLDLPLRRDEAAMNQMLSRALAIQVRPYRRDRLLMQRVRQVLLAQPRQAHNAQDLATTLNTSTRTLHRQLRDEGTTLQALKDSVRRELALALLQRSSRPIKQVADAAGFQNEKSFIRAFKGWTGMTPGEWRGQA